MKAKELAEQLLKNPNFDVQFEICTSYGCYEHPWPEYTSFVVKGIEDVAYSNKVIVLEVDIA